jgi:hypothetical protein
MDMDMGMDMDMDMNFDIVNEQNPKIRSSESIKLKEKILENCSLSAVAV